MKKVAFIGFVKDKIKEKKFDTSQIINMNALPLTFDCHLIKLHLKADKIVNIVKTENEKMLFTCVLACAVNGQKLKTLLIFKHKFHPKIIF